MTAVPPYSPSLPDWQRQVSAAFANLGTTGALTASFSGVPFTTAAYYSSSQWVTNAATPGPMYSALQGGTNATEAFTSAIIVPATATNHQTNAVAGYIESDRAQVGNGGDVAGYFQAVSNATNSAVFALNALMADAAGKTGQILSNEIDVNVNAADTTVTGINLVLVDNTGGLLTGPRNGYRLDKAFGTNGWSNGLVTADGAIDGYAAFIGSQTSVAGTNREGQQIGLVSYNAANTRYIAAINGDSTGGMQFQTGAGAFSFLNPARSAFWAYIDASGLTVPEKTLASVATPAAGSQTLFIDNADHKLKRKDSSGTVTIIA